MRFRVCSLFSSIGNYWMDNLRPGGAIRGISGTLRREGRGEWCGYSEISMWYPLPVLVKYRGVGTREQVLNILITCWWYVPSKPSSLTSTGAWLKHTASMAVLEKKLRRVPQTTQSGWGVESGALFLESGVSVHRYWWLYERLPHTWTAHRKCTWGVRGLARKAYVSCWSGFSLHGVHRFESLRLSDVSNRLFVAAIKK
jgi:hypothetical protein